MNYIKVNIYDDKLIDAVYDILKNSGQYMLREFNLHHWEYAYSIDNIKKDIKTKNVYILEDNGEYLATFMYTTDTSIFFLELQDSKAVYISKFAVNPTITNKGIGTNCLEFVEKTVAGEGKNKIRLDVYAQSLQAINFYHKNGFTDVYKRSTSRFEVICMEKKL